MKGCGAIQKEFSEYLDGRLNGDVYKRQLEESAGCKGRGSHLVNTTEVGSEGRSNPRIAQRLAGAWRCSQRHP